MGKHSTIPALLVDIISYPSFIYYFCNIPCGTKCSIIMKICSITISLVEMMHEVQNFSTVHFFILVPEWARFLVNIVLFSFNLLYSLMLHKSTKTAAIFSPGNQMNLHLI